MKKMNKLLALILAAAMSIGMLSGCSSKEEPAPAPEAAPEVHVPSITADEVDLTQITTPAGFVAEMPHDTVVATAGGYDITAEMLMYWFNYVTTYTLQQYAYMGRENVDWTAKVENGDTIAQTILDSALDMAAYYVLLAGKAQDEYGLAPTQTDLDQVMADMAAAAEEMGGEEMAKYYMWMGMTDVPLYEKLVASASLEQQLQAKLFGEGGELAPTDAELIAYATDELGYYGAKHILLVTVDMNTPVYNEDGSLKGFEPLDDATVAKQKALVEDLKAKLDAAADPVALFDTLMMEYSEDTGLSAYPDGYIAYKGQMVQEFEQTALALNVGEISDVVESLYGYHIIMRTPLDPEEYREDYTVGLVDEMAQGWLNENPIEGNEAYAGLDAVKLIDRMMAMQEAIYEKVYPAEENAEGSAEPQG